MQASTMRALLRMRVLPLERERAGPVTRQAVDQQRHAVRLLKQVDIHGKMQVTLPKNGLSLAHHELTAPHDGRVGKVC